MAYRRKVKKVLDGDTFELYRALKGKRFVRLGGIDTPERGEGGFQKAKNELKKMIEGRTVSIKPSAVRRRLIAEVTSQRKSVNERMRKRGY